MKKVELNEDLRPLYHSKQKSCRFSNVSPKLNELEVHRGYKKSCTHMETPAWKLYWEKGWNKEPK